MPEKICILPSSELTTVFGKIGRQASYVVCEDLLPGRIALGCMPALFSNVQEDVGFVKNYPVITIEGHTDHHAAKLLKKYSVKPAVEIDVEKFLKDNSMDISDSSAERLGPNGEKAVESLAAYIAKIAGAAGTAQCAVPAINT